MLRRIAPAVGLFFLAPLVAEYLLGNLPITMLPALLVLAPFYGGGALLIREVARRRGLGWPSIILFALAFGVLEEGLTTQSLFNPNYANQRLLDYGFIPALGIGLPWTLFVLALHTVWSISVPIALVEVLTLDRQTTPWLGRVGLAVTAVLFVIGAGISTAINMALWPYVASVPQFAGAVLAIVALVAAAFVVGRPAAGAAQKAAGQGPAPSPWLVGGAALVAGAVFMALRSLPLSVPAWVVVLGFLLLSAVVVLLVRSWSARPGWGDQQRLALAGGALLTYAWHAFVESPVVPVSPAVDLIGDVVFGLGAVALLVVAARRVGLRLPPLPAWTTSSRQESRT
jgi:hypothetical protein